ncbi:MAG: LysR family transcriptional regulator [Gammaproteobacteria bacterium]|nr:MAG: LysR family transcriptional regulator [Gammaproteobacteria bacterium]
MSRFRALPPMVMLTTFESASRNLNIKKTAEELGVTPSAVSLQLKNLEEYVGIKLFNRGSEGLSITEQGKNYFETVRGAFEVLLNGVNGDLYQNKQEEIRIVIPRNFGISFFKDALCEFEKDFPNIKIKTRLIPEHQTQQGINFNNNDYDGAILWGNGIWSNMNTVLLYKAALGVFGSGRLFNKCVLEDYSELADYPWLISWTFPMQWVWVTRFLGVPDLRTNRNEIYASSHEEWWRTIAEGSGIGISERNMLKYHDQDDLFVNLIDVKIPAYDYYLSSPQNRQEREPFVVFKDWLKNYAINNWLEK